MISAVVVPGVMAIFVAPDADQLRVVLEPCATVAGDAAKELMVGTVGGVTVTLAIAVVSPAALVALRV